MAHPTIEQKDAMRMLELTYGEPTAIKIEHTEAAYGLIWVEWESGEILGRELGDRNLFIKPDGSRLSWAKL